MTPFRGAVTPSSRASRRLALCDPGASERRLVDRTARCCGSCHGCSLSSRAEWARPSPGEPRAAWRPAARRTFDDKALGHAETTLPPGGVEPYRATGFGRPARTGVSQTADTKRSGVRSTVPPSCSRCEAAPTRSGYSPASLPPYTWSAHHTHARHPPDQQGSRDSVVGRLSVLGPTVGGLLGLATANGATDNQAFLSDVPSGMVQVAKRRATWSSEDRRAQVRRPRSRSSSHHGYHGAVAFHNAADAARPDQPQSPVQDGPTRHLQSGDRAGRRGRSESAGAPQTASK
jgi:hypothetical protein